MEWQVRMLSTRSRKWQDAHQLLFYRGQSILDPRDPFPSSHNSETTLGVSIGLYVCGSVVHGFCSRFKKIHERFYCSVRCLPSFLPSEAGCGFGMVWEKAEGPPRVFRDSSLIRQASCWFLQGRLGRNDCLVSSPSGHPSWQEGSYRFRWGLVIKWSNSHIPRNLVLVCDHCFIWFPALT